MLVPVLLFALAFIVRALSWPSVLSARGVHLPEPDAWYHLRRVVYAARNAPDTLGFDPFLNFPHGATAIWPPLLDAGLAWALLPFVGVGSGLDVEALERAVVWAPPLLGALSVVALHRLAQRHFGGDVAWVAGVVLAVLPGAVAYARVGVLDHHVVVALVAIPLLDSAMRLLRRFEAGEPWQGPAAWLALWQVLILHLWPGALLHVSLVAVGLLVYWLTREHDSAQRVGASLSFVFAISGAALLLAQPSRPEHLGPFTPLALSLFQPTLFAAGALVCGGFSLLWGRASASSRRMRVLQVVAACGLLATVAALVVPDLVSGLGEAGSWLAREERFQGSVVESRPLLAARAEGGSRFEAALQRLSAFFFLLPLAWAALVALAWREARPERLLFAGYALGLGAAALLQMRFVNSASAPVALLFGFACAACWRRGVAGGFGSRHRFAVAMIVAIATLALLAPALVGQQLAVRNTLARLRGEPVSLTREDRYWHALEEVAVWLRERTPSAGDPWTAESHGRFGVLGHWQTGHLLLYRGERPVVVGNFGDDVQGDNYRLSFAYFRLSEEKAVELLDELRVRYVVVRPIDFSGLGPPDDAIIHRFAQPDVGDASRHRLVYERHVLPGNSERPRGHFRVFERVEGARVEGASPAGSVIEARLPYVSATGRKGVFIQRTAADASGRYRLRLPYATRGGSGGIVTADAWQIRGAPGQSVPLEVSERAVREGERVAGPRFR